MNIRKVKEIDIENNLLDLYIKGFNMHYENRKDIFPKRTSEELKEDLIKRINNQEETIFVIEDNNKILGYTSIEIKNKVSKTIWINEIMVDTNHQNKGYGTLLINEIYKFAEENNAKRIELNCWSFNKEALKFYNKLGFKEQRIIFEKKVD